MNTKKKELKKLETILTYINEKGRFPILENVQYKMVVPTDLENEPYLIAFKLDNPECLEFALVELKKATIELMKGNSLWKYDQLLERQDLMEELVDYVKILTQHEIDHNLKTYPIKKPEDILKIFLDKNYVIK